MLDALKNFFRSSEREDVLTPEGQREYTILEKILFSIWYFFYRGYEMAWPALHWLCTFSLQDHGGGRNDKANSSSQAKSLKERITQEIIAGDSQILAKYVNQYRAAKDKSKTRLVWLATDNLELAKWFRDVASLDLVNKIPAEVLEILDKQLR